MVGTEGPDVIVANGATTVTSLGGADSICVTGQVDRVTAGLGDDRVDTTQAGGYGTVVNLGGGSDTFVGGPMGDRIATGDPEDQRAGLPLGVDTITTGAGKDKVLTGPGRDVGTPNHDVIVLRGSRDTVQVNGAWVPSIDGGHGSDQLKISSTLGGDWVIDAAGGAVSRDGVRDGTDHVDGRRQAGPPALGPPHVHRRGQR